MVTPFVDVLTHLESPLHFCVDEGSQKRRGLAEMMAAEGDGGVKGKAKAGTEAGYELEWFIAALEAEGGDLDRGRGWLKNWAPSRLESAR